MVLLCMSGVLRLICFDFRLPVLFLVSNRQHPEKNSFNLLLLSRTPKDWAGFDFDARRLPKLSIPFEGSGQRSPEQQQPSKRPEKHRTAKAVTGQITKNQSADLPVNRVPRRELAHEPLRMRLQ